MQAPRPPKGTRTAGRRLWRSILDAYELEEHELALLKEMTRIVDRLDELDALVQAEGVVVRAGPGHRAHPALVEARQQQIALARLAAALRLPAGEEDSPDAKQGMRRPQRRVGARGVYGIRGSVA